MIKFNINPCSKPRQTRSDKWKKRPCVMRYRAFADELRIWVELKHYELQDTLDIEFHLEMPKSWSIKKRALMDGKPHKSRPDIDNLIKSFMDALSDEDSFVWKVNAVKLWAVTGSIIIKEIK